MLTRTIIFILPLITSDISVLANNYNVRISTDDPIVKGGTIHFIATVYEGNDVSDNTNLKFYWDDNAIPQHSRQTDMKNATDLWAVTYEADKYAMGTYIVNVVVKNCLIEIVCYEVASARSYFDITETLNGKMLLVQKNKTIDKDFVSNTSTVTHEIELKETDWDYIKNATTVLTYWFIDCTYYGITTDMKFLFNYTSPGEEHSLEALVMADFTPPPPTTTVPPSTTTTKPTTTTTKPTTTTSKPTTTTSKPTSTTTSTTVKPSPVTTKAGVSTAASTSIAPSVIAKALRKRSVNTNVDVNLVNGPKIMTVVNGSKVPYNVSFPYVCNGTQVATDSKKTYGYFFRKIEVKAPVAKVNVTGNNWIQHGDLLKLRVQCRGSRNIEYCVEYKTGAYNVTGNETCYQYIPLDACDFQINRYLSGSKYTILIIIRNEVSKVVQPVAVTFYEVTTQPQLSVIVVPVAFSLVAVVLIVFGIAYYIQNRSRFVIEVADFNFGQQYSDLEYKTFRERLRDSIVNAFTRGPSPSSSEVPVWPPGRKYGSMT
ncbi:uncharacterized protein LOC108915612 isoform X1 [Anoplophora glabripennis]|uniref:uncharacterized protein LOC108915612 isoform X1 n=1 Tax=Anoplophora glabripennis TaxID=217634 RepID=UPI0008740A6E|nr:uncharacterized protein LOC108915612 isoform X1 [Anoplophora glabripennis]